MICKDVQGKPSLEKRWEKYYSNLQSMVVENYDSAYLAIKAKKEKQMDNTALSYYGRSMTYRQMFERIDFLAGVLKARGVHKGDIVTLLLLNTPNSVCLFYALNKLGAIANLMSGVKPEEDLIEAINLTESKLVFTLDLFIGKLEHMLPSLNTVRKVVVSNITDEMSFAQKTLARTIKKLAPKPLPENTVYQRWEQYMSIEPMKVETAADPSLPAAILYTSGTTGGSKGVLLSNQNIIRPASVAVTSRMCPEVGGRMLGQLPLFVVCGLVVVAQFGLMAGLNIILRLPGQESMSDMLQKHRPNYVMSYPEDYYSIDTSKKRDLSFLKLVMCGSEFLSADKEKELTDYFAKCGAKAELLNGYGMTECASSVTMILNEYHRIGSVGFPLLESTISAFDVDTGEEMNYGEVGELCVCSEAVMMGYYKQPQETEKVLRKHKDGRIWMHTGDLGYIDEDGYVFINGRIKRNMSVLIGNSYERVFAPDIEAVIRKHPAVMECFVVSKDDEKDVHIPVAFVCLNEGNAPQAIIDSLRLFTDAKLNEFQRPRMYVFVDRYPLTPSKKVDCLALEKVAGALPRTEYTEYHDF